MRYGGVTSNTFSLATGVRQGSLMGVALWAVYLDDLQKALRAAELGTLLNGEFRGVHAYADDIVLTSSTLSGLQEMVNMVEKYAGSHQIRLNPAKTVALRSGSKISLTPSAATVLMAGVAVPLGSHATATLWYLAYQLKLAPRRSCVRVEVFSLHVHVYFGQSIVTTKFYQVTIVVKFGQNIVTLKINK